MKKYFNWVDYTVFSSLIGSIIWLSFYKLIWIDDTELIFHNADKWADIAYTVITSIVASSFFYIATVFLSKVKGISEMKKQLPFYLDAIDDNMRFIINMVKNSKTGLAYTYDEFMNSYDDHKNSSRMEQEFTNVWGVNENSFNILKKYILINTTYLNSITLNYSDILISDILKKLRDNSNIYSYSLNILPEKTLSEASAKHSLYIILHIYGITNKIRTIYNIYEKKQIEKKDRNYIMNMQIKFLIQR
jgi:hypothetical protein